MDVNGIGKLGVIVVFIFGLLAGGLLVGTQSSLNEKIPEYPLEIFQTESTKVLSPAAVVNKPAKYLGENVVVVGYYINDAVCPTRYWKTKEEFLEIINQSLSLDLPEDVDLLNKQKYRFEGVVEKKSRYQTFSEVKLKVSDYKSV